MKKVIQLAGCRLSLFRICIAALLITASIIHVDAAIEKRQVDSLLQVLDAVVDSSAIYDAHLHQDLVSYRTAHDNAEDDETRCALAHTLFKTYRKLRLDSALFFARQRVQIAQRLGVPDSLLSARLDEADALKCLGRLNDALADRKSVV